MKRLLFGAAAVAALTAIAYAGWRLAGGASDGGAAAYRTAEAKVADIVSTISATGTVVPEDVVDVGTQVNGMVDAFGNDTNGKPVDYGSTVTEGALLARIDDTLYSADSAAAEAQLAQATAQVRLNEANLAAANARFDQAERDWGRAQKLGPSRSLAEADYDAAKSAYEQAAAAQEQAKAQIAVSQAAVGSAQASLRRAKQNLVYCTINSPVNGVIIDRRVDIGQTVVSSLNAPSLFLIAKDLSRMQVLVQVNEADIGHVKPGDAVTFTTDAFPGDTFKGVVRRVRLNATLTQNVVTYTVEIVTDNSSMKLLPYLTANVQFVIDHREQVLAVPNAALRWSPAGSERQGPPAVWVLGAEGPKQVQVRPGLSDGTLTEVASAELHAGDKVVLGEAVAGAPAAGGAARSPFAPTMRGGGRGR